MCISISCILESFGNSIELKVKNRKIYKVQQKDKGLARVVAIKHTAIRGS